MVRTRREGISEKLATAFGIANIEWGGDSLLVHFLVIGEIEENGT